MKKLTIASVMTAGVLSGCAMYSAENIECLQPDRRVVVEINGTRLKPAPKPVPGKPEVKPEVKPGAKPPTVAVELSVMTQGNSAFDPNGAVLKAGGKEEIDGFLAREVSGKQPVTIASIIITGHSDKLESGPENYALSEKRAEAVRDYLVSKGLDQKLMFWEGRGSRQPVPVTKFCS